MSRLPDILNEKYRRESLKEVMFGRVTFVCVTLISVKSKYGSCSGNCTGLIKINNSPPPIKKKCSH